MQEKGPGEIKRAILSVTNDLSTDQRVHKVALSLIKMGYEPLLVGRCTKLSKMLIPRPYKTKQLILPVDKGPIFYALFNLRLFFFLISKKVNILISNDLDTLLANFLVYKLKKIFGNKTVKLVYDSHELFTEVPELSGRRCAKKSWLLIEKFILPKLKNSYTVCEPIAKYYNTKYRINMQIVRNMPLYANTNYTIDYDLILPKGKKIILYQGALNVGRGIEHIIGIMDRIEDAIFVIAGNGGIEKDLHKLVKLKHLENKVLFAGRLPLEKLTWLTKQANVGLVLQEDIGLSYRYVLPNRLFDFIKEEVPVLASNLPEIKAVVEKENIGLLVEGFERGILLESLSQLLNNPELINIVKQNLKSCKSAYCWENEEHKLFEIYTNLK